MPPETLHSARLAERRSHLRNLFDRKDLPAAPFLLEIGCGHGHFLAAYGQAHPEQTCVGVDVILERIERAERKRRRAGLSNVHFVRADAFDFLAALPEEARFTDIFALFPDPWPKRRHHKNRLFQGEFLRELARRSLPTARFLFRTDHREYFESVRRTVEGQGSGWRPTDEPWPFDFATVFQERAPQYQSLIARPCL